MRHELRGHRLMTSLKAQRLRPKKVKDSGHLQHLPEPFRVGLASLRPVWRRKGQMGTAPRGPDQHQGGRVL
ncbi:hypothetical protein CapIbe_006072 [Capra ibex]